MRAQIWLWQLDSNLELLNSFVDFLFLLVNFSKSHMCISIFWVLRDSLEKQSLSFVNFGIILEVKLSKSDKKLCIIWILLVSEQKLF